MGEDADAVLPDAALADAVLCPRPDAWYCGTTRIPNAPHSFLALESGARRGAAGAADLVRGPPHSGCVMDWSKLSTSPGPRPAARGSRSSTNFFMSTQFTSDLQDQNHKKKNTSR